MPSSSVVKDVVAGLVAGWAGAQVKAASESFLQDWAEGLLPPAPGQRELPGADPTGHPERMPPTLLYRRLLELTGRDEAAVAAMSDDELAAGALWLHRLTAYGYPVVYALLVRRVPWVGAGAGMPAAAALFGALHGAALPAVGVQASPARLPRAWWVWEGGSHLAYGAAVDLVVSVLRRVLR